MGLCPKTPRIDILWAITVPLALGAAPSCSEDTLTRLSTITDEFTQSTAAEIDILWVVDNSESMAEEQSGLGQSFTAFITNLTESDVDYHIGVISTDTADGGMLHDAAGTAFIHPDTSDPLAAFIANVTVGTGGSRIERAFESAAMALGKGPTWAPGDTVVVPNTTVRTGTCLVDTCDGFDKACSGASDCDRPFLRDSASLFIIMVSDENDKSFGPVGYYRRLFESYKGPGNEGRISVSAIVGDPDDGCSLEGRGSASAGDRYIDLAAQTGGIFTSICDDFAESLRELSITAAGLDSVFELSSEPNTAALVTCGGEQVQGFCVSVEGQVVRPAGGQGWQYLEAQNAIVFGVNSLPGPQERITVEYQPLLQGGIR